MQLEHNSRPLALAATWPSPIDIEGLNVVDRIRIKEIGLDKWLEEIALQRPIKERCRKTSLG